MFDTFCFLSFSCLLTTFHFNNWTTRAVFYHAFAFNSDVSKWNVGVVTDMSDSKSWNFLFHFESQKSKMKIFEFSKFSPILFIILSRSRAQCSTVPYLSTVLFVVPHGSTPRQTKPTCLPVHMVKFCAVPLLHPLTVMHWKLLLLLVWQRRVMVLAQNFLYRSTVPLGFRIVWWENGISVLSRTWTAVSITLQTLSQ